MKTAILRYTISDDKLRKEFEDAIVPHGFEKHHDQSTYTYPVIKVGQTFLIGKFSS